MDKKLVDIVNKKTKQTNETENNDAPNRHHLDLF